jgi:hypothetical protein
MGQKFARIKYIEFWKGVIGLFYFRVKLWVGKYNIGKYYAHTFCVECLCEIIMFENDYSFLILFYFFLECMNSVVSKSNISTVTKKYLLFEYNEMVNTLLIIFRLCLLRNNNLLQLHTPMDFPLYPQKKNSKAFLHRREPDHTLRLIPLHQLNSWLL